VSILQLKNITVIYGNPPLLDGVELVVQPKERVCLVGRNGSGKSTLMKVIAGVLAKLYRVFFIQHIIR
jgi:ATP-binding cassette subfamily F protein uup